MKKATFICKPANLDEILELRQYMNPYDYRPVPYVVKATKELDTAEWDTFTKALLADRDWIADLREQTNAGPGKRGCILVTCKGQPYSLLFDPQGYDYARYVAILKD